MYPDRKNNRQSIRRLTRCGFLTALAIALSLAERLFPLEAVIPIPGIKLGLANVVTLFALAQLSVGEAFSILICRVALSSLLMGSVTAFLFSLFGGCLSLLVMNLLLPQAGKTCSLPGISMAGAAAHHIGQVAAAVLWMKTTAVVVYLPPLLVMSIPLGIVTGITASVTISHLKKIDFH